MELDVIGNDHSKLDILALLYFIIICTFLFRGTEKYFKTYSKSIGITLTNGAVGFMGPNTAKANPSYEEVCRGNSGHVEVYYFEYTGGPKAYEQLVKYFYQFHDPTTMNKQGNDSGTQYASVIYVYDKIQEDIANQVKKDLQSLIDQNKLKNVYSRDRVTTDIRHATTFYPAHAEHQAYLDANPNGYCNHRIRFSSWPEA